MISTCSIKQSSVTSCSSQYGSSVRLAHYLIDQNLKVIYWECKFVRRKLGGDRFSVECCSNHGCLRSRKSCSIAMIYSLVLLNRMIGPSTSWTRCNSGRCWSCINLQSLGCRKSCSTIMKVCFALGNKMISLATLMTRLSRTGVVFWSCSNNSILMMSSSHC